MSPVGPLPPQVYWRRRAAAVGTAVLVVVLLVWLVTAMTGGSDPRAAALVTGSTAPATNSATTPSTTTTRAPTPTTPPAPASAPTTAAAPAVPACPDASIGLRAQVAAPSYPVGELPVFRILVSNTGATPCTRDLDAALQSATVYAADGTTRVWSSNDCFPGRSTDSPTLTPGKTTTFSVKWSRTTSEPTCTADRAPVAAGAYQVVVSLGTLTSAPAPFTLTAA